jgi:GAF domain-containing protein
VTEPRSPDPTPMTRALETLGRLSLRELSIEELLQTITELALTVTSGDAESSVTLVVKGEASTVASSGRMAIALDERQYEGGVGPCLHSARSGEITEITDARTDDRWGEYTGHAFDSGMLSSLSIPLEIDRDRQVTAALNIYAHEANAFDDAGRAAATSFGAYAAVATANLHAYRTAQEAAENLQVALTSRATIDQAKGILMERHRLTADQAFQVLAEVSMSENVKVREVADHLVRTGELPVRRPGRR